MFPFITAKQLITIDTFYWPDCQVRQKLSLLCCFVVALLSFGPKTIACHDIVPVNLFSILNILQNTTIYKAIKTKA